MKVENYEKRPSNNPCGRPRVLAESKVIGLNLTLDQIAWLERQDGGRSKAARRIIEQAIAAEQEYD